MLTPLKEEKCNSSMVAELLGCIFHHARLLHWLWTEMSPLPSVILSHIVATLELVLSREKKTVVTGAHPKCSQCSVWSSYRAICVSHPGIPLWTEVLSSHPEQPLVMAETWGGLRWGRGSIWPHYQKKGRQAVCKAPILGLCHPGPSSLRHSNFRGPSGVLLFMSTYYRCL